MIIQVGKVFPYHCHGFLCILLFYRIVLLNMNKEGISVLILHTPFLQNSTFEYEQRGYFRFNFAYSFSTE